MKLLALEFEDVGKIVPMKALNSNLSATEEDSDMAINKWTVMFFFASDNALSPVIVSQLKAIKEAGFQENTEVLVYFDPSEKGVPTKIYNVNWERKSRRRVKSEKCPSLSRSLIGDGEDPFVHNLEEDDITPKREIYGSSPAANEMFAALNNPDDISAQEALKLFLNFCRVEHRAEHYILFLVGHGMVVANDAFLPDENPVSSITLTGLGDILEDFSGKVTEDTNAFELLALHSCSMSAIEVAYELQGTAKLMMASEGISYVNSYPHRQLLKKLFKTIERAKEETGSPDIDVRLLMRKLYFLSFFNAKDFNLSGYPLDLALFNLEKEENFTALSKEIKELVKRLKAGVSDKRGKELILLAHLEAQSYWGESYTDLFDFCRCLYIRCEKDGQLEELRTACEKVMTELKPRELSEEELAKHQSGLMEELEQIESAKKRKRVEREGLERLEREKRFQGLVIYSDSFGSAYQYSHGLSVYFPWAEPVENAGNGKPNAARKAREEGIKKDLEGSMDAKSKELLEGHLHRVKTILERYADYKFTKELKGDSTTESENNSWLSFLKAYFDKTRREQTRKQEDHPGKGKTKRDSDDLSESQVVKALPVGGVPGAVPSSISLEQKDSPSSGVACSCTTIKNYPVADESALEPPLDMREK